MNDEERLRTLVRALLPFALAAHLNADVRYADDDEPLRIMDNGDYPYATTIDYGWMRELKAADLRAAADALRAAGYADALTNDSARAALEGDE